MNILQGRSGLAKWLGGNRYPYYYLLDEIILVYIYFTIIVVLE
jgi:hypothetical protein